MSNLCGQNGVKVVKLTVKKIPFDMISLGSSFACTSVKLCAYIWLFAFQCKHLLAVHMAEALGLCKEKEIADEEFAAYLCSDCSKAESCKNLEENSHRD